MKDRIRFIMNEKKMSQQDFASTLNISPASLSSIYNGRTNPTNNHVNAIHLAFPEININWLMFGEGEMYGTEDIKDEKVDSSLSEDFTTPDIHSSTENETVDSKEQMLSMTQVKHMLAIEQEKYEKEKKEMLKKIDNKVRKIVEIRIFFDDGTYETYSA